MPKVAGEADVELNFHDEWREKKGLEDLEIFRKKNIGGGNERGILPTLLPAL